MHLEADETVENNADYLEALSELKQECDKKRKKNHARIKELMDETFIGRRTWILNDRPLVTEVLDTFPPLSTTKAVSGFSHNFVFLMFFSIISSVMSL